MIDISFPDGNSKQYPVGTTGMEIAASISKSLAKEAMVVELDGELLDLSRPLERGGLLRIITTKDEAAIEVIRHDAAHIIAEAVKELFPEVQVTIGPTIENGFYYDFARDKPFSSDDLAVIEKKMHQIVKRNNKIVREEWERQDAIEYFKSIGEHYKAEIIADLPADEPITLYRQGEFVDLCRGPHGPSTGKIKHFKLMKVAGAYWRGDSNNAMLQRIYGTAWATKEQLDSYVHMLEEAVKRDHRRLGKQLDLFHFQEEAQGMVFWHHKGWTVYRLMEQYIRNKLVTAGYQEVKTPIMVDSKLWQASGHWDKFGDDMFTVDEEDKIHALKPMNCPCHIQIFKQDIKSYRNLPLRMSEFGACFRNEASGALHGLLRVRNFVQDDAHIFCTKEQINSETVAFCALLKEVYQDFGFDKVAVKFSDRPEKRAGSDETWNQAESALRMAVEEAGLEYEMNPGEGAFYGPKLEFVLTDSVGRHWQCGTIQVDFVLPERLGAEYVAEDGSKQRPVMLHRAIIGTFERFMGILIEQYAGAFPLWLAPVQVAIATISNKFDDYARQLKEELTLAGVRVEEDLGSDKINYKIRQFSHAKVPLIAVIGAKEQETGQLTLRKFGGEEQLKTTKEELINMIKAENEKYFGLQSADDKSCVKQS